MRKEGRPIPTMSTPSPLPRPTGAVITRPISRWDGLRWGQSPPQLATHLDMRDRLQSKDCARLLKAVADPERLKIIQCLQTGAKNVSELSALLGTELANVSHHIRVLWHAGLVCADKQGRFVVYSLNPVFFRPKGRRDTADTLDLGCCRLELTGR